MEFGLWLWMSNAGISDQGRDIPATNRMWCYGPNHGCSVVRMGVTGTCRGRGPRQAET